MSLELFIRAMPKVELHVHLEGSIQPETLLTLAQRNGVSLPASSVADLRTWYTFRDFSHFVEVYLAVSACICTLDDIEFIAREFLSNQAAQNIHYSEVTYTAFTHYHFKQLAFADQLQALNRARAWAEAELGITMGLVIDIPRSISSEAGLLVADWAISAMDNGVVALGLGGPEVDNPPQKFTAAFARAYAAGLPAVPHAGETVGAASVWGALHDLHAVRIGHGVRCLEDSLLIEELRVRQTPLEVCPTSNVCLGVVPSLAAHPLPDLLANGLFVTLNSDDPALFNTTLTDEYLAVAHTFDLDVGMIEQFVLNSVRAALLPATTRATMETQFIREFAQLHTVDPGH